MKIIIVDDDQLVALSLKTILESQKEFEIIAIGTDGKEAVDLYDQYQPDVLLMDIQMKQMNGLDAGEIILNKYPSAKILLLTTFSDDSYIISALKIGACGYLLKHDYESIAPALLAVHKGQHVYGADIITKIPNLMNRSDTCDILSFHLTDKEFEIIKLVANGKNNKEISEELYLSEGTVRNYLSTILEKLCLRDRTQLAIFYYQQIKNVW